MTTTKFLIGWLVLQGIFIASMHWHFLPRVGETLLSLTLFGISVAYLARRWRS